MTTVTAIEPCNFCGKTHEVITISTALGTLPIKTCPNAPDWPLYLPAWVIRSAPVVRKARIGWWVDGSWCPTRKIRDHWVAKRS